MNIIEHKSVKKLNMQGFTSAMDSDLTATYRCEPGRILLKSGNEVLNIGLPKTVSFKAKNNPLNLVIGDNDYLLWPRSFGDRKGLTILKNSKEGLRIIQNIDMGREEVATQRVPMTIERGIPKENITVTCDVTLSFSDTTY